ncbi:N-acetyltransferase [Actinotalea sp. K2]|uniref:GNAT family N-acetyltransferase n=1 Tax=Actinotalea sp. K2 TaxID=2939438 RepID=UPI0020172B5B|nr:N-acetyltransferase [Actinotalea sp. K2]MCL3862365.1 GNAT family N-acetyltransferase [Actinotalea sp. K2]
MTRTDPRHRPAPVSPQIAAETLPPGWVVSHPAPDDVDDLHLLLSRHEVAARGRSGTGREDVDADLTTGGLTRRHLVVRDPDDHAQGWATVHDRAAGRVLVSVVVDPDLEPSTADTLAEGLFGWTARAAAELATSRGLDLTQMDSGAFADDLRQQRWLTRAGFEHTRTWWQMSRPVDEAEGDAPAVDQYPGVVVRQVRRAPDGMPEQADLITVHDVLEEAFTDHFNYHAETFDEFVSRLREDPGHRWDHWWIAEIVDDQDGTGPRAAGALVGTVSPGAGGAPDGTYVAYLGVLRSARGRGAARSLLDAVIADAAARGRDRVGLEVDAESPTGAVDLYTTTGFSTSYVTQSWHRDLPVGG